MANIHIPKGQRHPALQKYMDEVKAGIRQHPAKKKTKTNWLSSGEHQGAIPELKPSKVMITLDVSDDTLWIKSQGKRDEYAVKVGVGDLLRLLQKEFPPEGLRDRLLDGI